MVSEQAVDKSKAPAITGSLFYLFFFLALGAMIPFLNVYYLELGFTGQQIGWLSILFPLMTLLLATPISTQADKHHRRVWATQIAVAGLAIMVFLYRFPTSFAGIFLIALLFSICASPIMSIGDSLIARMAARRHLNFGKMRLWGSIGFASSAWIFGILWERTGFLPMFLVGALFLVVLIFVTGRLEEVSSKSHQETGSFLQLFQDRGLVLLVITIFLAGIALNMSITFEGIYIQSLGGSGLLIGLMAAFSAYAEIPTMLFASRIGERFRGGGAIILAYGLLILSYAGFVLFPNPNILPVFAVLKGLGVGLFIPNVIQIITHRTPEKWAATAQSLNTIAFFGIAPLVSGPLGGYIYDTFNATSIFIVSIFTLGCAIVILWVTVARGKLN